jgi:hypothetical protein
VKKDIYKNFQRQLNNYYFYQDYIQKGYYSHRDGSNVVLFHRDKPHLIRQMTKKKAIQCNYIKHLAIIIKLLYI